MSELQTVLDGKTDSLRRTYQAKADANDKVWELNERLERDLAQLASKHEQVEEVGKQTLDFDQDIEDNAQMRRRRGSWRRKKIDVTEREVAYVKKRWRAMAVMCGLGVLGWELIAPAQNL